MDHFLTYIKGPDLQSKLHQQIMNHPELASYLKDLDESVEAFIKKPIPVISDHLQDTYYNDGRRLPFESVYFERRHRLLAFCLNYLLKGRKDDLFHIEEILTSICLEFSWGLHAHRDRDQSLVLDLFACETGAYLSEITSLLKSSLSGELIARCHKEIRRRVLDPFINTKDSFPFELMTNNWNAVCAGSIGIAAIYLEEEYKLHQYHKRIEPTLLRFLDSFEADGTCLEGIGYWNYGMAYFMAYVDLSKGLFKDSPISYENLIHLEKFKEISLFQQRCLMPGYYFVNFSDSNKEEFCHIGLASVLKNMFDQVQLPPNQRRSAFHSDHCYRWTIHIRNLIWPLLYKDETDRKSELVYNPVSDNHSYCISLEESPTRVHQLPHAMWLIIKDGHLGLAVKGGHNGEPHNHNDLGNIIFYKHNRPFICELGSGEYTKAYFSSQRYDILCTRSMGHSLPIIDGQEQMPGHDYKAKLLKMSSQVIDLDLTQAYDHAHLKSLNRKVTYETGGPMTLIDTYELSSQVPITERFITPYQAQITENGFMISHQGNDVFIHSSPVNINKRITPLTHMNHQGIEETYYALDFQLEANGKIQITITII